VPFAPVKKLKISQQVAASIRDAIVSGQVRPSEPLPSERELAERFGVNRSSVREALHRLEAWGLVQVRQGYATVVRNFLRSAGPELLPFFAAPAGRPDPKFLTDLLAIRSMLLTWTARQAAARGGADLGRLRELAAALAEPGRDPEELQLLDFDFFQELVHLADNRVLMLLTNAIRHVYLEKPALFTVLYQPGTFDPGPHQETVAALERGDAAAAAAAMTAHAAAATRTLDAARAAAKGATP